MFRKSLVGVASVILALAGTAWAADDTPPPDNGGSSSGDQMAPSGETPAPAETPAPGETPPPARTPIMDGMDRIGVGPEMDKLGLDLYGYIEGGYLLDFTEPRNITAPKTLPGDDILFAGPYKNQIILDQVDLTLERAIDPTTGTFNFGFKVDGVFGRDAYFTHSDGMLDQDNKAGNGVGQENQLDIPEAYIDMSLPVAGGLLLEAGKFEDLFGVEKINPTENQLYTHSYAFSFGMPFTQTGVLSKIYFPGTESHPDQITTFTAGITRGWNQSTSDNNGVPDGVFGFYHRFDGADFAFNLSFGPEGVLPYGPSDNADWWALPEIISNFHITDQLTLTGEAFMGSAQKLTTWDGLSAYVTYALSNRFSLNGRIEYYHDGKGLTTGVGGNNVDYGEVTYGVGITPMPNDEFLQFLTLRPEIRYDWASAKVIDAGHSDGQFTAAIDVLVKF